MESRTQEWLLDGPAWIKYAVETQLLDSESDVLPVLENPSINIILKRLRDKQTGFPALGTGKITYKETGNIYWDLFFTADLGVTIDDLGLRTELGKVFDLQAPDGIILTDKSVQPGYLCMSAILLSSMAKMGYKEDPRLIWYIEAVMRTQLRDGGWSCYMDTRSCPMDNLNILMLLGQYDVYRYDQSLHGAIDLLLEHWDRREEGWHPDGFGIGKRFKALQYPAVKYGILRVLDALSLFPYAVKTKSFQNMLDTVRDNSLKGRYFAESPHAAFRDFDFGQTKEPSRWVTFLVNRIEKRAGQGA